MLLKTKFILSNVLSFFLLNAMQAQQHKNLLSVNVKDISTGNPLPGTDIDILQLSNFRSTTNANGSTSFYLPSGKFTLIVSYTGYDINTSIVEISKNTSLTITLKRTNNELSDVSVLSYQKRITENKFLPGVQRLDAKGIKNIPVIFGEKDMLKTLQLLPGIKSAGDGNSGFYVRGGGGDQNLILLDGAPIYNPSHLLGFFSSFNSDVVKDLVIYKAAMPAQYGGRLSSLVNINTLDGDDDSFHINGGIGLVASRLTLQGPLKKNKGSFLISARRTYADMLLKLSNDSDIRKNTLYFYDINAKFSYNINDNNKISLSGYRGKDKLEPGQRFGIVYGNTAGSFQWTHLFKQKLSVNTAFAYTSYNYDVHLESGSTGDILLKSRIRDLSFQNDWQYHFPVAGTLHFGFGTILHSFNPGVLNASSDADFHSVILKNKYAFESNGYISHDMDISPTIHINYGLRFSTFTIIGPGTFYRYNKDGNITDSTTYSKGKIVKNYPAVEPRASISFSPSETDILKLSYDRTVQNLHLISNTVTAYPTDLWIPSSPNVKPETGDQISIGYFKNLSQEKYELSSEIYYKRLKNQIDYKNGAELQVNENVESQLLYGIGRAYGWEILLKKNTGKLSGWISYTLSRTERKINGINDNDWYPVRQDQTHSAALVAIYRMSSKWTLSANWIYNTGNAVTYPAGKYTVNGTGAFYYTERNGHRMPAYHHLDISATLMNKKHKKWQGSWTFSLYNVYGRENPYTIEFNTNAVNAMKTTVKEIYLFRWVPSVTYNFSF